AAVRSAETANAELQAAMTQLRDELGGARQALSAARERLGEVNDDTRHKIAASEQAASSNADRIAQLTRKLDQAQRALRLAEAQRATMMARLSRSEVEGAQDQARRQEEMRTDQEQLEKKLRQLAADREKVATERNKAEVERDRLRARVGELEQKLSLLQTRQPPRPVASAQSVPAVPSVPTRTAEERVAFLPPFRTAPEAPAAVAPPVPAPAVAAAPAAVTPEPVVATAPPQSAITATAATVSAQPSAAMMAPTAAPPVAHAAAVPQAQRPAPPMAVPAVAHGGVAQFERVLASAGVDVRNLFSQFGVSRGMGGPYIPNPRGSRPEPLLAEKLAALSRMIKSLPVAAPLHSYEIGSRFGVRGDPINGRAALHTGTDFRAPYMSPVYATAEGVVTFSGYRDDYGKIVEIDHGNGLVTRYGHLHRTTVSVGQRVAARTQVGLLGSTGRATGPHVHYEVLVNGEPQDAEKFMALGRIVPIVAQR
ncbi:MAG TPA: peptidoglycan DD-metalloendopeptidase family protein, partial [Stellaceae bacterium]|nr:peptidoglycan DD-metalloendopeptidase family protein [Stellaceae bacterium]